MSYNIYVSGKNNLLAILLELIRAAKNRIWLETFILSKQVIIDELKEKGKQLVDIRLLLDLNKENEKVWLNKKKEIVRYRGIGIRFGNFNLYPSYHIKMGIIDEKVLIGSCNISDLGLRRNREILLVFDDPVRMSYFEDIFNEDWNNGIVDTEQIKEGLKRAKVFLASLRKRPESELTIEG